jgi:hypothetical protein
VATKNVPARGGRRARRSWWARVGPSSHGAGLLDAELRGVVLRLARLVQQPGVLADDAHGALVRILAVVRREQSAASRGVILESLGVAILSAQIRSMVANTFSGTPFGAQMPK